MQTMGSFFLPNSTDAVFVTAKTMCSTSFYFVSKISIQVTLQGPKMFQLRDLLPDVEDFLHSSLDDNTKSKAEPQQTDSL